MPSKSRNSLAVQTTPAPPAVAQPAAKKKPTRRVNSGEVGSGFGVTSGIPDIDYLAELGFPEYVREFRRVENDPAVARGLRSNQMPVLAADWSVEPASDDARDVMIAEFVGANLYQQEGDFFGREFWCRTPWHSRLRDALRFLSMGFAIFQKVYRTQGRFIVFDKLKYLMPESIERWRFDETDEFLGIERTYIGADGQQRTLEKIAAEELFIYTWDQEGSNILGKPLIRPAWMDFNIKTRIKKLGVIDKQKTAVGVPFFKNRADDSVEDKRRGDQIAKAMRSGNYERLWARIEEGQDFGWKEGGTSTKGLPDIIRQSNEEISGTLGDKFLDLGSGGAGGSRGVSGTQAAFGGIVQTAIVRILVMFENALGREMVDLNWSGVRAYPKAKCSDVDPFEKTRTLPDIMQNMGTGKAITKTMDTENEIRRRYKLMEIEEEEYDELNKPAPLPPPGLMVDPEDEDETPDGEDGETAADEAKGPSGKQENRRRITLQAEVDRALASSRIDLAAMRRDLERFESLYYAALAQAEKDMRQAVVEQVRTGRLIPRRTVDVKLPFQEELRAGLLAIAKMARDYGRERIEDELRSQLMSLAKRPIPNPTTRRGAMNFSNDQARVTTDLDVTRLVTTLQEQTVAEFNRLAGAQAGPTALADGLEAYFSSLTDRRIADMARQSTPLAFNQGRHVGILEHRAQLGDYAIRVEVDPTDPNTCEPCQDLNGVSFKIGSPGYMANQPPAHCLGKLRCRGFYVVEAKEVAA